MARQPRRRCAFCSAHLPADARSNRKYCDADCRAGRSKKPDLEVGPVASATEAAISAAGKDLTGCDAGAVAALRHLANKIDTEATIREAALRWIADHADEGAKPPPIDNVSVPTYLKYCEALGLTPSGRRLNAKPPEQSGGQTGGGKNKLTLLAQGVPRPGA